MTLQIEPQEKDELQKITITLISLQLNGSYSADPNRRQILFTVVYEKLKSLGYRVFAAEVRTELYRRLGGRSRSEDSTNLKLIEHVSELQQELQSNTGSPFHPISFRQKPHSGLDAFRDHDVLQGLNQLENLGISDCSTDMDLKLTVAAGIACARRSRVLDLNETHSFLESCWLLYDRFNRLNYPALPNPARPPPASMQDQLDQVNQTVLRYFNQVQVLCHQQMLNQQNNCQFHLIVNHIKHQLDEVMKILNNSSRWAVPSEQIDIHENAPPPTPESFSMAQLSIGEPYDFVSDSDD